MPRITQRFQMAIAVVTVSRQRQGTVGQVAPACMLRAARKACDGKRALHTLQKLRCPQDAFAAGTSRRVTAEHQVSSRPDLATAKAIVAGGRALKSKEDFAMLDGLAAALGGAVGASRALVDAGIAPNELQVQPLAASLSSHLSAALLVSTPQHADRRCLGISRTGCRLGTPARLWRHSASLHLGLEYSAS